MGPILAACWYRPPHPSELGTVHSLHTEWEQFAETSIGTIIVGDMNIHNPLWLRFSPLIPLRRARRCASGALRLGCMNAFGHPPENPIYDLVLSDLNEHLEVRVAGEIADHRMIIATLALPPLHLTRSTRIGWIYRAATWKRLRMLLAETDWS